MSLKAQTEQTDVASGKAPGKPRLEAQRRIVGLDIARTLALIGMITSHLLAPQALWAPVVNGYPAALFAVLAGFTLALMARRGVAEGGLALVASRYALTMRGIILIVLHQLIAPHSGSIFVVLMAFGVSYIALAWVPRWGNSSLWLLLVWLLIASGVVHALGFFVNLPMVLNPPYPVIAWMAYMVAGLLGYRYLLHSRRLQIFFATGGLLLGAVGAQLRWVLDATTSFDSGDTALMAVMGFFDAAPHSGGLIDLTTSMAAVLGVISLCLLIFRGGIWSVPLQAMGSMSLTVYVLHVVTAGAVLAGGAHRHPSLYWTTLVVAFIVPWLIKLQFRRGPLEWAVSKLVALATRRNLPGKAEVKSQVS